MSDPEWEEWSPPAQPHVKGRYTKRTIDPETMLPNTQDVEVTCTWEGCKNNRWRTSCSSGQVRSHIARFGAVHHHKDPLA